MTSRRRTPTHRHVRNLFVLSLSSLWVSVMVAGCAALPEDAPVMEQLDSETGVTIARLGHPMELYRETFQRDPSGRFAFIGPFETNQMGQRELFLWIALPVTIAPGTEPDIELNGHELKLGTPGRDANFAGLQHSPYKIPTPWSAMLYYKIDADVVTRLADANSLAVRVSETTKDGPKITVFAASVADTRLKDFAAR